MRGENRTVLTSDNNRKTGTGKKFENIKNIFLVRIIIGQS